MTLEEEAKISAIRIFSGISNELQQVEIEFERQARSNVQVIAYLGEYLRASGGKRVRPALTILSNYAVGGDGSRYNSIRMARDPERSELALGVDVLAPEGYGEVIGGGERATSLEFLQEQIALHQLPEEAFQWYLDLRRYGSVPHAGFGMGIERCTAWMCGIEHIRETIPFPRMLYRIRP